MAKRVRIEPAKVLVRCADCRFSIRDTSGPSHNAQGEFFLCRCEKGRHINMWGETEKLFINKPRECKYYKSNK